MKAISLLQPWASLVVMGAKIYETWSWKTSHRGPILIHASKAFKPEQKDLCYTEPFRKYIGDSWILPTGRIIGMVFIDRCFHSKHLAAYMFENVDVPEKEWTEMLDREMAFGDFSPGRYGWALSEPKQFKETFECKGALSLWDPPPEVLERIYMANDNIIRP